MKLIYSVLLFLLSASGIYAQELSQITFSGGADLTYFSFQTEQGVLIRVTVDGKLVEWGMEVKALNGNYYHPQLQPFQGRVVYYGAEGDSVSKGKVKMIGTCAISYYGPFENDTHIGKVKTIGTMVLDYFSQFENKVMKGKLKSAGSQFLDYYSAFENESYRGKLKSVGSSRITYYSVFDDRMNKGKIKSIGPFTYTWYSAYDRKDMAGGLKSGINRQRINGITYLLW